MDEKEDEARPVIGTIFLVYTLRLLLLAGTNFSVLVVCCIWQVFILAFLR